MSSKPLVSVVIPAYNASRYVEDALKSVLGQNYPSLQVIVVNDGSTDNTLEVLSRFKDRIQIIDKVNEGSATARNAAFRVARGKYIAFLDSDDFWLPGKLETQIRYMEAAPSVGVTYGLFDKRTESKDEKIDMEKTFADFEYLTASHDAELIPDWSGWIYRKMLFESLPHTITVVMRADLVANVGYFDEGLRRGQDYDYWIRLSRVTEFHKLAKKMAVYRIHGENITKRVMLVNSELAVVKKAIKQWGYRDVDGSLISEKEIDKRISELNFNFAYQHCWKGDAKIAYRSFLTSWRHNHGLLKNYLYLPYTAFKMLIEAVGGSLNWMFKRRLD
jgi:glycosyltransferase involved in cell wall biosynthesis